MGATGAALKNEGRATEVTLLDIVEADWADGVDRVFVGNLEDRQFIDQAIAQSGPFDTILCLDVLEHLIDPWSIVPLLHKSLTQTGIMIISVPNLNHLSVVIPLLLRGRFDLTDAGILDRTHLRWFTRSSAIELATCSGLALDGIQANINRRKHKLLNWLTLGFFSRFFASQYVLRVRRAER